MCVCVCVPACVHREEAQDDEGAEEAAPPCCVHADGDGGFPASWACTAARPEASQREEADARRPAGACVRSTSGTFQCKDCFHLRDNLAFFFDRTTLRFWDTAWACCPGSSPAPPGSPSSSERCVSVGFSSLIRESDVCCVSSAPRTRPDPAWHLLQTAVLAGGCPLRRCRPGL